MSSRPGKFTKISKILPAFTYELTRDKKEYFAINNPSSSKIEFHYGKSLKPLNVKNERIVQTERIIGKAPAELQSKRPLSARSNQKIISSTTKADTVEALRVNELIDKTLKILTRLKASKITHIEKVNEFVKLIQQLDNEICKNFSQLRKESQQQQRTGRERIIMQTDRLRSPRRDYQKLIEERLASVSSVENLEEQSMPEFSSVQASSFGLSTSDRDQSVLASHEMDIQDLFVQGVANIDEVIQYRRKDAVVIDDQLSQIHDESSPDLVSTGHEHFSSLAKTCVSDLESESAPELSSFADKSSAIDDESSPNLVSAGRDDMSNLQDESMPDYSSYVESVFNQEASGQNKSIRESRERSLMHHESSIDQDNLQNESMPHYSSFESSLSDKQHSFRHSHRDLEGIEELSEIADESSPELINTETEKFSVVSDLYNSFVSDLDKVSFPDMSSSVERSHLSSRYSSGRDRSILQSQEMDTESLFKDALVDSNQLYTQKIKDISQLSEEFSQIDEESSPELISTDKGNLEDESMPHYSSFASSFNEKHPSFRHANREHEIEDLSEIADESSPELINTETEKFSVVSDLYNSFVSDLDKVSFPDMSSSVEKSNLSSRYSSGRDRSILQSQEMDTESLFKDALVDSNLLYPQKRKDISQLSEEFSQIDEESSPELISTDKGNLEDESMPHYSSFASSFNEKHPSFRQSHREKEIEELSEIADESSPEFINIETGEFSAISDLYNSFVSDLDKVSFPDMSSFVERSNLSSKYTPRRNQRISQSSAKFSSIDKSNIQDESMPNFSSIKSSFESHQLLNESMPFYSSSELDDSILKSNEMFTEDLFEEGEVDPNQLAFNRGRSLTRIDEHLSDIDEESSPEFISMGLDESRNLQDESMPNYSTSKSAENIFDESFPQVSSTFDRSARSDMHRSLQSHGISIADAFKDVLSPRRDPSRDLRRSIEQLDIMTERDANKDEILSCAFRMIGLQKKEIDRTKTRFNSFIANVADILKFRDKKDNSHETLRNMFDKLEEELQSFVSTPKDIF